MCAYQVVRDVSFSENFALILNEWSLMTSRILKVRISPLNLLLLTIYLFIYLFIHLFIYLFIYLSIYVFIYLFIYLLPYYFIIC